MKNRLFPSMLAMLIAIVTAVRLVVPTTASTTSGRFTDFGQVLGGGDIGGLAIGADGKIYGTTGWPATNHLFLFDPSNASIVDKGVPPVGTQDSLLGITIGPDGKVYGGAGCEHAYLWVYDPANGSFANLGVANAGKQCLYALVTGTNGKIYVGTEDNSTTYEPGYLVEYNPTSGTFGGKWGVPSRYGVTSLTVGPDGKISVGTLYNGYPG